MINKKINLFIGILFLALTTVFTSCDEVGDTDPGGTSTQDMAGDWYVQTYVGDALALDYQLISTYNTSDDDGTEMWIDDHAHIWTFKAKTPVTTSSLSFSGTDLESSVDGYDITVNISNGIISLDDTETSGGNTANGISFDIEFSDDPGTIYTLKGYKRTGFTEDEH